VQHEVAKQSLLIQSIDEGVRLKVYEQLDRPTAGFGSCLGMSRALLTHTTEAISGK